MYNAVNSSFYLEEYYARLILESTKLDSSLPKSRQKILIAAAEMHYDRILDALINFSLKEPA